MNANDVAELVERARNAEDQLPPPPTDLVPRARAAARRRTSIMLLAVVVAALVSGGSVFAAAHRDTAPAVSTPDLPTPPAATRLVGARGLVVAVPSDWSTEVEQGSYCGPIVPRMVHFFLPTHGPVGSCAIPTNGSWPAEDTLTIATGSFSSADVTPDRDPSGTVAGMRYFVSDVRQTGPGVARSLVVPDAGVRFTVAAATPDIANALLATIRPAPNGTTTIAVTLPATDDQSDGQPVLDRISGGRLRSRTIEVQAANTGPGQFLRTVPPIGTPVRMGVTVTMVFSAGDLFAIVSARSFAAQRWTLLPANVFDPAITREQALHLARHQEPMGGYGKPYGTYLRRLDGRLVWLVTRHYATASFVRVTAVDADTGAEVKDYDFPQRAR